VSSLFEDLLGRPVATEEVPIVLDRAAHAAATRAVDAASRALVAARERGEDDLAAEYAALTRAEHALAEVPVRRITVKALPPKRWNELRNLHPPADDAKPGALWNPDTFRPALLAESVVPPEGEPAPTAAQWQQLAESGSISDGEINELFFKAIELNGSAPQVSLGKG
jgi:hypothetical protein